MKTKMILLLAMIAVLAGCYYDSEQELYNCSVDPVTVKYSTTVTIILNSYGCTGCHSGGSPSGGINLTSFASVRTVADNGRLMGAITHSSGFVPMPQGGGKMNACDISKVKAWIDAGAPNN